MAGMIRFHLDEHIAHALAAGLRQRGVDVTTTSEVGLGGSSDEEQLGFAASQARLIVTHDPDFLDFHKKGWSHFGIAYCDQGRRSLGDIIRTLVRLWEQFSAEDVRERVFFL